MIIFGTTSNSKKKGYTNKKYRCKNCRNVSNWSLTITESHFTLFFIPLIPYRRLEMFVCPICDRGVYASENADMFESLTYFS